MEPTQSEFVLAVIQTDDPHQRLVFASRNADCPRPIVLRQESFSPDIGWFTQSSLAMTRQEMTQLRAAMGGSRPPACQATHQRIQADAEPRVLRMHALPAAS